MSPNDASTAAAAADFTDFRNVTSPAPPGDAVQRHAGRRTQIAATKQAPSPTAGSFVGEVARNSAFPTGGNRHPLLGKLQFLRSDPTATDSSMRPEVLREHIALIDRLRATEARKFLRSYSVYDAVALGATSVIYGDYTDGRLTAWAGFAHHRRPDGTIYVGGAAVDTAFQCQGVMKSLLAREFDELGRRSPDVVIEADIRICEDGLNVKAYRTFRSLGMREHEIKEFPIGPLDTGFAVARGRPGFFQTLRMRTAPGWQEDVQQILRKWGSL